MGLTLATVATRDTEAELTQLGLTADDLTTVGRRWYIHRTQFTPNHPPSGVGISCWTEAVAALRDRLVPRGWTAVEERGSALTRSPGGQFEINVAAGNSGTGVADATPQNRCPKGIRSALAVASNQKQLSLPLDARTDPDPTPEPVMWFLLLYRGREEVRCELALPSEISPDGYVTSWAKRILIPAIPVDQDETVVEEPESLDIDIDVRRK